MCAQVEVGVLSGISWSSTIRGDQQVELHTWNRPATCVPPQASYYTKRYLKTEKENILVRFMDCHTLHKNSMTNIVNIAHDRPYSFT